MHDGFTPTYFAINVTLHENLKDCTPFSDFCSSKTMKIHTNSFSFGKSTIHVVSRRLKTGFAHLSNNKNRPRVNLLAFPGPFFDKCWYPNDPLQRTIASNDLFHFIFLVRRTMNDTIEHFFFQLNEFLLGQ